MIISQPVLIVVKASQSFELSGIYGHNLLHAQAKDMYKVLWLDSLDGLGLQSYSLYIFNV